MWKEEKWVRAGSAVRLAGALKLSERRRDVESKDGAAVWGKIWHFCVRRHQPPQRGCAGEVTGNSGPATATSSIPGVRAGGPWTECGAQQHFGTAELIWCSVLAGKARYVGKACSVRKQCL